MYLSIEIGLPLIKHHTFNHMRILYFNLFIENSDSRDSDECVIPNMSKQTERDLLSYPFLHISLKSQNKNESTVAFLIKEND